MIDLAQLVVSLDTQRVGDMLQIRPHLESPPALTLQYRLTVRQNGPAGTSSLSQSGELHSGETSSALVQLSLPPGATCLAHLDLLQDGQLLKQLDGPCE
ncbi:curli-like amyloid fiber formation chaperone CsgH (plasmid) [Pseudomonas sp. DTU_2021_1001937_2_SI_NGA_ILE_001]|uniref:curli-like amyloid fiber formation chaperone CsgH n=1 Tax=Pseudomonas sp. DTU_2021_1001937_2_SI_NGA_ILE_001 TaxID=3077589 RepID=UPI0028FC1D18|nr:curli-like amyloid fiber formation chaperone CsgH [Pseudomonas sp. DTU_2021_1001937_2_SI_NGA_ILE_001]WNW14397.1 curli-like amyloid fiber formation chaperone CsgH [Pseudomonas sp. DTU_2021_1001937_2_SI_NGA_ILE_001]